MPISDMKFKGKEIKILFVKFEHKQIGTDRNRQEQTGTDRNRQEQTGSDRIRQDQTGSDRIRQDYIRCRKLLHHNYCIIIIAS